MASPCLGDLGRYRDASAADRRLRILRVVLGLGDESAALQQFSLAAPESHEITLCTYFPITDRIPPRIEVVEGDGSARGFLRGLDRALRTKEYDLVHAHTPHVALLALVAAVLRRRRLPPTVVTVHNSYPSFRPRNKLLFLPVFATAQRVVCCGEASHASFPALYKRLAGARLRAVPNGTDIGRIDQALRRLPPRASGQPFTVVAVSRLVPIKNPVTLLEAFLRDDPPRRRLIVIGTGPMYAPLQRRIEARNTRHRVELTGLVSRDSVYHHLGGADLFISTSLGEGLPIAVLEAMACRCPVVLSDIGPHREIARDADFIPLVDPRDVEGFSREIARFETMHPDRRAEIGEACRHLVEQRFSVERMHEGYGAIFAELLNERR